MELDEKTLDLVKKEVKKSLKKKKNGEMYDPMAKIKSLLESVGKDNVTVRVDSVTGNTGKSYATVMLVYGE